MSASTSVVRHSVGSTSQGNEVTKGNTRHRDYKAINKIILFAEDMLSMQKFSRNLLKKPNS